MNREKFKSEHLDRFEMRDHELLNLPSEYLEIICNNAVADAVIGKDGEVIAIIGFFIVWERVAEVFVVPSKNTAKYPIQFVRHVRRELDRIMIEHDLRRLHSNSLADKCTAKWMEALGFHKEGTMKQYSVNGDDYDIWARFA